MSKPLEHRLGEATQGHNSKLTDSFVNTTFHENYSNYTTEIKVASDSSNDHNNVLLSHKDSVSMPVANEHYVIDEHNYVCNMYSNQQPFMGVNTCMHVPWDDSQSDRPLVACMEPPHLRVPPNSCLNLHTVDFTNTWFYLESDNSDNYYVYIHRNNFVAQEGFYILKNYRISWEMAVLECTCHPMAPIHVFATNQLHVTFPTRPMSGYCSKHEAKRVYSNFIQDCITYEHYGTPYVPFMTKVIDCLINLQDKECHNPDRQDNDIDAAISTPDSQTMARLEPTGNSINQDIGQENTPKRNKRNLCDINDPHKSKGFIALQSTEFSFIVPDRQATDTSGVDKYLEMALIIRKSGLPNYRQARIPLAYGLNIEAWKRYLHNYPDQNLFSTYNTGSLFPLNVMAT